MPTELVDGLNKFTPSDNAHADGFVRYSDAKNASISVNVYVCHSRIRLSMMGSLARLSVRYL
jgi:hypothetical protein